VGACHFSVTGKNAVSHLPAYTNRSIKEFLIENGASGTIYAFAFPESRQILEEVLDGGDRRAMIDGALKDLFARHASPSPEQIADAVTARLAEGRKEYTDNFEAAWTGRQDSIDRHFFEAWKDWAAPVVKLQPEHSNFMYPTAGASEGLREAIGEYAVRAGKEGFPAAIHVFDGEYEGFAAYADSANIAVVRHNRADWRGAITQVGANDQFFISQPSAIDGNVWDDFDDFAKALYKAQPKAELLLDVTYVGAVAKDFQIDATHPNIPSVFFSLSKPFGIYYHRVGGFLSRTEHKGLLGNKWFKSVQALQYGTALLKRSGVFELARKYRPMQEEAIASVGQRLGIDLKPADVLLFGTAEPTDPEDAIQKALLRGPKDMPFIRLCITPELARLVPGSVSMDMDAAPIPPSSAVKGPAMKDMLP
jgi:hypothetical protein